MRKRSVDARSWAAVALACTALVTSSSAQAQVKLQYKYPEGQKLTYNTTEEVSQVLKLAGQAFPTDQKQTVLMSMTFGKKREGSTQPIAQKVEAYAVEMSLPGGIDVSYDSKDPNAKIANPQLSYLGDVYKLISQFEFTVVLDAQNKVKAVEGTEKTLEKTEKLAETAKQAVRHAIDTQHLKEGFEEDYGFLPDGLLRPGESWEQTVTHPIGGGQTLTFRKRFEYAGTEKRGDATLDPDQRQDVRCQVRPGSPLVFGPQSAQERPQDRIRRRVHPL